MFFSSAGGSMRGSVLSVLCGGGGCNKQEVGKFSKILNLEGVIIN